MNPIKTLQPSGERVHVEMNFYDFHVTLPKTAADVAPIPGDDFVEAEWISLSMLPTMNLGETMKATLRELGYLSTAV